MCPAEYPLEITKPQKGITNTPDVEDRSSAPLTDLGLIGCRDPSIPGHVGA